MTTTEQSIYKEITDKLKDAPKNVLERVLGYVDGVLDIKDNQYLHELKMQIREDYTEYRSGKSALIDIEEAEKNIENSISRDED
ncbi:hypothetical protein ACFQO9_19600 [Chryseobacterium zhengzhouense]|uniref:Addiction module antitoxin n=1 Tax=Chryseobacterium zhengzhouense TaxID=1636086 RepID=A0ABW2M245_9FLAO